MLGINKELKMLKRALEVTSAITLGVSFAVLVTGFFAVPWLFVGAVTFFAIVSTTF